MEEQKLKRRGRKPTSKTKEETTNVAQENPETSQTDLILQQMQAKIAELEKRDSERESELEKQREENRELQKIVESNYGIKKPEKFIFSLDGGVGLKKISDMKLPPIKDGEGKYFHVLVEKVNFNSLGEKTDSPKIVKYNFQEFENFQKNAGRLGYSWKTLNKDVVKFWQKEMSRVNK